MQENSEPYLIEILKKMNDAFSKTNTIVAGYFRVSTGRQENEQTIESQIDEVKKRIEADGNILPAENIFIDDGWSGELLARPSLDQMRDAAKEGRFNILYVYDRGRLSRTFAHQEIIIEELNDRDIKFMSLHDFEAVNAEGKVMQAMQGVFHEYERVKIAERMRRGKLYKAKNGTIINGQALYGYSYTRTNPKEPVRYEINEAEAKAVRLMFQWFAEERVSLNEIKKRLYDLGIKPRKRKSLFWTKGPIVRILKCDTYFTGTAYYNKSEAVVAKHPIKEERYKKIKKTSRRVRAREDWIPFEIPKLIDNPILYEKAQQILSFNQKYACKRKVYNYLLSGLVYCECGNRRSGDGSNKYGHHYYRCIDRLRSHPYPRQCKSSGVNAALLDAMVWRELKRHLTNYSLIKKYAERWIKSQLAITGEYSSEKQRLMNEIGKINDEEARYSKAYGAGSLDFEQFQQLMKDAKKRKVSYNKQLANLADKSTQVNIQIDVNDLVEEAKKIISSLDFTDKFKVIRDIISKIIVTERSGAEIWIHLPLPATITEKLGYGPERRDSRFTKCR